MTKSIEILVPDIGDYDAVEVIEVLVNVGDDIQVEDTLITLESDKASMEIPATAGGKLVKLNVKIGDNVSESDVIGVIEATSSSQTDQEPVTVSTEDNTTSAKTNIKDIIVPDIGGYDDVEVIEILVSVGDRVEAEQSLITLESDKASMEIPSPRAGIIKSISVSLGDRLSETDVFATIEVATESQVAPAISKPQKEIELTPERPEPPHSSHAERAIKPIPENSPTAHLKTDQQRRKVHASPSIRRYARELGADLTLIPGSGNKQRIRKEDVKSFIKNTLENSTANYSGNRGGVTSGAGIPPIPDIDFSKFGEIDRVERSRIPKLSAANLHRAWLNLPMVTHHDEADITDLEDFRKLLKPEAEKQGVRVTGLAFHMKALAATLMLFPKFNSSLSADGQALFYKKYCHIGIAVDTPNGLVVPVIRDVNKKSIYDLAHDMADISERARNKKLKPDEMQGASMTISSLGGIGGTAFTPIVNAPEVAILGITRAKMQPVWNGSEFEPKLICPFDLTYDHRVIDGADAARFMVSYCQTISDIRRLVL